jgi:hypothetical protein
VLHTSKGLSQVKRQDNEHIAHREAFQYTFQYTNKGARNLMTTVTS